jgi:arabinogalactan oligomer/maltooligosaccharide transport system permease protein
VTGTAGEGLGARLRSWAGSGRRNNLPLAYALLLPSVLVMALVVVYPFLYNFRIAFSNMNLYTFRNPEFVGFRNFVELFRSSELYSVLLKTVIWTGVNVVAHVVLGVALALLLNRPIRGRWLYRALLILPWAMPQYISALTWRGLFNYEYGAVNLILVKMGLDRIAWLSDPAAAFSAALITNIWLGFPFMMVIALGGLQSIPNELYEVAAIDGASWWRRLRHITIPLLKPVLVPAIVLGTIWTFNNLNVIWLVTNGGKPADKSHILVTYVYKAAFEYYRYGYAAAFSFVIFLLLLLFVILYMRVSRGTESVYG